jgi:alpha-L-rhamnosidase
MNLRKFILLALLSAPITSLDGAVVENLRCEYLKDPLGIDVVRPRLSWVMEGRGQKTEVRGQRQNAYQILVASSQEILAQDQGDLWDSGKVENDRSIHVAYEGKPLESRTRCYWKVRVWDEDGEASDWSQPALWTMGLLKPEEWTAKWIGWDKSERDLAPGLSEGKWIWDPRDPKAVGKRFFRNYFDLPEDRRIKSAILLSAADNQAAISINGDVAAKTSSYTEFTESNVTQSLRPGRNLLAVAAENVGNAPNPAGIFVVLRVEFAEGDPLIVATDTSWRSSVEPAEGWDKQAFDDSGWTSVTNLGSIGAAPWTSLGYTDDRRLAARYLRREFTPEKKIARATAYVCGLGFFELYLNGSKVSDHAMSPALSDYSKAAYYSTFDVTAELKAGKNAIGVVLGNGRFFAPRLHKPARTKDYGYPKLRLQLEVVYEDGTRDQVVSDENWTLTTDGPIRANNEYDGEEYDARMEMPGWNTTSFDDSAWNKAQLVEAPGGELQAQMIEPMRVTEVLKPVGITQPKPGVFVVDMGQNFYGTVRFKGKAPRNTEMKMISAYSLLPDGMLKKADNRHAKATDLYIFKGEGEEVWSPIFKGQGFRRVQITGHPGPLTADQFEGLVIHTDTEPAGQFECSNDLVNRIHHAMRWGFRMFLRSAPLDPDRDERQPWLGDPAKDAESKAFNFNIAAFYTKFMDDIQRSQRPDGTIPDMSMNWNWGDQVEWPSVYTIIPDWFYDFYGDDHLAADHYESLKRWVLTMQKNRQLPDGTIRAGTYGDWCDAYSMDKRAPDSGGSNRELISTAYHYNNCRIMARAAQRMGKEDDVKMFSSMADELLLAFNKVFLDTATGIYAGDTQCGYVLPLAFGMVPAESRDKVIENLVNDILVKHDGHLTVGLIGMQWLMQTLTDIGRPDVAWKLATQTTRPSWGYMIGKGATTIWERWDSDTRDPGMNSEALLILAGNLDAWFYQTLAGIRPDTSAPGFKSIVIQPYTETLEWVNCHHDSPYGRIVSNWKREGKKLTMEVTIPANTTATVYVPAKDAAGVTESGKPAAEAKGVKFLRMENDRAVFEVASGSYEFQSQL